MISSQVNKKDSDAYGTCVTVHNLFGHLPVRYKSQASNAAELSQVARHFDALKLRLVAHLLAFGKPVSLRMATLGPTLRFQHTAPASTSHQAWFSARNLSSIFRLVNSLIPSDTWRVISARAGIFSVRAAVCLMPQPSKKLQFISFGKHPIPITGLGTMLYDAINATFELSTFGVLEARDVRPHSRPAYNLSTLHSSAVKGVDRWPCFYIRVETKNESLLAEQTHRGDNGTTSSLQEVVALLKVLMVQFLESQHLDPKGTLLRRDGDRLASAPALQHRPKGVWDDWKIIKSTTGPAREDPLCRLPSQTRDLTERRYNLDEDVRLLLDDIEMDPMVLEHEPLMTRARSISPTRLQQREDGGETLTWTNPHTGNLLRISTSNGLVVHAEPREVEGVVNSGPSNTELRTHPLRTRRPILSSKELASRLEKWTSRQTTKMQPPIPSLAPEEGSPDFTFILHDLEAASLADAEVIGQIDKKFIFCTVPGAEPNNPCSRLLLIDQHAADERVKVEAYHKQICSGERTPLAPPILFDVTKEEASKLQEAQAFFSSWAVDYGLKASDDECSDTSSCTTISITHLPPNISERCRLEPRIIIDVLRKEIWRDSANWRLPSGTAATWMSQISRCPEGLLDILNSRACRSAIMFNDTLTTHQCRLLLNNLAICCLPFQCAHGRPSMTLVTTLEKNSPFGLGEPCQTSFGKAFKNWHI